MADGDGDDNDGAPSKQVHVIDRVRRSSSSSSSAHIILASITATR